jgi:hypothetical protein
MKRIKITVICMSLLATLSVVGCVCPPTYYSGMNRVEYGHGSVCFDGGCDPCGDAGCSSGYGPSCGSGYGVIEYRSTPCFAQPCGPKIVNCRTTFSNLGNGVLLIGRGILDVTAAPFVVVGNALSSGCRYEVLAHCDNVCYSSPCCQAVEAPCSPVSALPCDPVGTSGCDTCNGGYNEGIQYNGNYQNQTTMLPPMPRRMNSVVQASYQEPTAPVVRFVQPMR